MRANLAAIALAVLIAGCSNDPSGQSAGAPGSLAFNGSGGGAQTSPAFDCDGSGDASFSANLGAGSVTVTVKDASGKAVYTKSASNVGQTADHQAVSGSPGSWTLHASRGSGFAGQYAASVDC